MKEVVLIGAGGHCHSLIDVFESTEYKIKGVLDKTKTGDVLGYPVLGDDSLIEELSAEGYLFFLAVGGDAFFRERLFNLIPEKSRVSVVSKYAIVSRHSEIGEGVSVHPGAVIEANSKIGMGCIINTGVTIGHDAKIGNFTHLAGNVALGGVVKLGNHCFIGVGAVISSSISICDNVVVGAGSLVLKDIKEAGVYLGNPVKRIK